MEQNRLDIVRNLNLSKFLSTHPWQAWKTEQKSAILNLSCSKFQLHQFYSALNLADLENGTE